MATETLTPIELSWNTWSADKPISGGTAIDPDDTFVFDFEKDSRYLIQVNNTTAGAKDVTIAAGFGIGAGVGAEVQSFAQDDVRCIMVESARFKNSSGQISITFEAAMTGFIQVFKLPQGA